ncbi:MULTISPECIES: choice-of-anchor L domain-containing protein [Chryseobacterium]|uniref:Gliding motility-associated C-terminal domain-containing protein n=1 Tax=Chryseobacterium gambrini TaxID=373672 RepID=A0A1N7NJ47_9FLAO|nr:MULTISPECIES: choice-of-anchor L domain-containing protein [Chryseobacterium]MCY1661279.1 choice-of-anchor L domain-containing protein [Chryseobacterium sp. SL1]SIS98320.1 gliding motility-associated C-terminal domain-containing protein [Chryseobacterium gambrini]
MLNYRLKNYYFFLVLLLVSGSVFAQKTSRKPIKEKHTNSSLKSGAFIDVNVASYAPSSYNIEQLVKNVLISGGSSCAVANVTNVTVSPNQPATDTERAWGYFHKGTTAFPFTDGVVLVTGKARRAGNVLESGLSDPVPGSTVSDPDLVTAINPLAPLKDAVFIEFDFVPNSTQVKFNYIFASEEYTSDFPCGVYSDGFALLLKKVGDPTYTNMAILPGTAGPVSVTNIVPSGNGFSCGPINEAYFGGMNTSNIETNFNGRTIPLTATATVIPGQTYHFKMVLADASDSSFDSAVFLQGGSFDIGMTIVDGSGNPLTSVNMCDNTPQTLTAQIASVPGMTFQWYKDGVAIAGATNATYIATSPGVYVVRTFVGGTNCQTATVTIVGGTTPPAQNATLKLCTTPSLATFNLNDATPQITTSTTAIVRYYVNQADAVAQNANYLTAAQMASYNGTDGQVLYVVVSNGAFCSKTVTLTLRKEATPVAQLTATKVRICLGESTTLTASNGATYQWTNLSGTGATQTVSPTQTTTYSVYAIGTQGCKSLQPASVTVEVVPAIKSTLSGGMICQGDVINLDAGAGPNYSYLWSNGATSQTISVGTPGTYSVTITNGVCSKVFTTQVIQAVIPEVINVNYNENGTMIITASNPSNGVLEYSVDNGLTWQNSNTFTNVPRNTVISIRVRVKNTSCVGFLEYFTFVMQNVITPNGDNINDIIDFRIVNKNKDFKASIFDRYGKEVYRESSLQPYWDGYFQGKRLNTSSYWYQVSFEDPASKKPVVKTGWILLKNFE